MKQKIILGAAIGDIAGSVYEFEYGKKPTKKEAIIFRKKSIWTDDTVMTCAIADWAKKGMKDNAEQYLKKWGSRYPYAGYGARFVCWIGTRSGTKIDSFGNGSAMRISPIAYYAKSEEELIKAAILATDNSHMHSESFKAAITVSVMIYRALHGATKEELREYALSQYDFESLDYDEMRRFEGHGEEICQVTVPQALWAFFHSDSFEDCLRTCISIGWDCDTLSAIACSIAEAYYKDIPQYMIDYATRVLTPDMVDALTIR